MSKQALSAKHRKPKNPERPVCGAKLKNGKGRCPINILYPNGRCRVHGGPTPAGIAAPNFKHGRRSRYQPFFVGAGLEQVVKEELGDLQLHSSDDALELLQRRVMLLLSRGYGIEFLSALLKGWDVLEKALLDKDAEAQRRALVVLRDLIKEGGAEAGRWKEIYRLEEQMDKLRDRASQKEYRHHKLQIERQKLVRVELVKQLMSGLVYAAKDVIRQALDEAGRPDLAQDAITALFNEYCRFAGSGPKQLDSGEDSRRADSEAVAAEWQATAEPA